MAMPENPVTKLLREVCPTVSVGILTANLLSLGTELGLLERAGVRLIHIDVMDGCFCPMMTVGPPFIKALKTALLKDVHLMIENPLEKVGDYIAAGADIITIHPDAGPHAHRTLQQIKKAANANDATRGIARGIALNPGTPLEVVEPLLDEIDVITLVAVNPGWAGQSFIGSTFQRFSRLKQMVTASGNEILLAIDGGVTKQNLSQVAGTGADLIVMGSAIFDGKAAEENAKFALETVRARSAPHLT